MNIGSNDELAAIKQCEVEVGTEYAEKGESKWGSEPEAGGSHLRRVYGRTCDHSAHPRQHRRHRLVCWTTTTPGRSFCSASTTRTRLFCPEQDALQEGVNAAIEAEILPNFPNVTFANPFPVFNKDAGVKAPVERKAICTYTEMCNPNVQVENGSPEGEDGDIHPTLKGYRELAKLVDAAYEANPAK